MDCKSYIQEGSNCLKSFNIITKTYCKYTCRILIYQLDGNKIKFNQVEREN
jgi:hypothetical protein